MRGREKSCPGDGYLPVWDGRGGNMALPPLSGLDCVIIQTTAGRAVWLGQTGSRWCLFGVEAGDVRALFSTGLWDEMSSACILCCS